MTSLLAPNQNDDVARALLTLTQELWVVADRLHVVETLLEREGVVTAAAIDRFVPDENFDAENARRRTKMSAGVFAALGVPQP